MEREIRDETNPGLVARVQDAITDVKANVTHARVTMEAITARAREFDQRLPSPNAVMEHVADFTRKNPLLALGAAIAVGLWINRQR
jgi:hypothetical protein